MSDPNFPAPSAPYISSQPQQIYVQVNRPASNGLAIAGLVLGIVGAALALIPLVGLFFCWLPAMLGIIFGCVGLSTANRLNGLNKAAAIWAIILGASPIPIVILQVIVGAAIGSATQ